MSGSNLDVKVEQDVVRSECGGSGARCGEEWSKMW